MPCRGGAPSCPGSRAKQPGNKLRKSRKTRKRGGRRCNSRRRSYGFRACPPVVGIARMGFLSVAWTSGPRRGGTSRGINYENRERRESVGGGGKPWRRLEFVEGSRHCSAGGPLGQGRDGSTVALRACAHHDRRGIDDQQPTIKPGCYSAGGGAVGSLRKE